MRLIVKKIVVVLAKLIKAHLQLTFYLTLALLLGLIILSNYWRSKQTVDTQSIQAPLTQVSVYQNWQPTIIAPAKIIHQGVIEIIAQQGGVVQSIRAKEGQEIKKGGVIAQLSSNYQGNNLSALQLEIAKKNFLATHANHWDQEKIEQINQKLNQNTSWVTYTETNPNRANFGGNGDAYTAFSGQQNLELLKLKNDITNRQAQLGLDNAELNYQLAAINASLMRPSSPLAGKVEKVMVNRGQLVAPGQTIAIIKADDNEVKLQLTTSESIIRYLDESKMAIFEYNQNSFAVSIDYLSYIPTKENTYQINFSVPTEITDSLPNNAYGKIHLPLKIMDKPLLPISSIYQSHQQSFVYVVGNNEAGELIAKQKAVQLGEVIGQLVVIEAGLSTNEQVIIHHNNLLDGQKITLE